MKYTLYDSMFDTFCNMLEAIGLKQNRDKRNFLRQLEDFSVTEFPKILELVYSQYERKEIKNSYCCNIKNVLVKQITHYCNRNSLDHGSYSYNGYAFICYWMAEMMSQNYEYWKSIGLKQVRWSPNTLLYALLKYGYKTNYFTKQEVIDFVSARDIEKGIRYSDVRYADILRTIWEYAQPDEEQDDDNL